MSHNFRKRLLLHETIVEMKALCYATFLRLKAQTANRRLYCTRRAIDGLSGRTSEVLDV